MNNPLASLSLDLDNLWSYQMTHGDEGWDRYESYLDTVVPIMLDELDKLGLRITVFVVGQDAAIEANGPALKSIAEAGHEIGNHSFRHQPWLHRYSEQELAEEFDRAEQAIEAATGQRTVGFRGPGYSLSPTVLQLLVDRGYEYDCSTLPTLIGPLARKYYFRSAKLDAAQREERKYLFGSWKEGLRPLKPYWWQVGSSRMLEIPVSVMPGARVPFHVSYALYLAGFSPAMAERYFATGLRACRVAGVEPSILLHPLDLLGADDVDALGFFPGMGMTGAAKREVLRGCLARLRDGFTVVPMREHAAAISRRSGLKAKSSLTASPAGQPAA
jgi:peptidoglycan/xylan/chitin deacetylase (PgdA/CDA1 family)